jgi:hypothetical protein
MEEETTTTSTATSSDTVSYLQIADDRTEAEKVADIKAGSIKELSNSIRSGLSTLGFYILIGLLSIAILN